MNTERNFNVFIDTKLSSEEQGDIVNCLLGFSLMKNKLTSTFQSIHDDGLEFHENQWVVLLRKANLQGFFSDTFDWSDSGSDFDQKLSILRQPITLFMGSDYEQKDKYTRVARALSHVFNNSPGSFMPDFLEVLDESDPYLRFVKDLKENLGYRTLTSKILICYLVRHIVYQLHTQPLQPYVIAHPELDDIVTNIHKLAFKLSPDYNGLHQTIQVCQMHQRCQEEISLKDLLNSIIRYERFCMTALSTDVNEDGIDTSDNPSLPLMLRSDSPIPLIEKECYTPVDTWLYFNFLYGYLYQEPELQPVIESSNLCINQESRLPHLAALLKKIQSRQGAYSYNKNILRCVQGFADISPVHTYFILTELKDTQLTFTDTALLEHYRLEAKAEYDRLRHIWTRPDQWKDYRRFPGGDLEKMLAFLFESEDDARFSSCPLEPAPREIRTLLYVIASFYEHSLLDGGNDVVLSMKNLFKHLGVSDDASSDLCSFLDDLFLSGSYFFKQLHYLDAPNLPIPVSTFLQSHAAGIHSFPRICGVTLAYFIVLLHCSIGEPLKTKKIKKAFSEYQRSILKEWFDFDIEPQEKKGLFEEEKPLFQTFMSKIPVSSIESVEVILTTYQVLVDILCKDIFPDIENSFVFKHYYPIVLQWVERIKGVLSSIENNTRQEYQGDDYPRNRVKQLTDAFYKTDKKAGKLRNVLLQTPFVRSMIRKGDYQPLYDIVFGDNAPPLHYFQGIVTELLCRSGLVKDAYAVLKNVNMEEEKCTKDDIRALCALLKKVIINHPQHKLTPILKKVIEKPNLAFAVGNPLYLPTPLYLVDFVNVKSYVDYKSMIQYYRQFETFHEVSQQFYSSCHLNLDQYLALLRHSIQCLLVNEFDSSYRQHAAAVLYPPHDDFRYYYIRSSSLDGVPGVRFFCYTPLWLSVISNVTPVIYYMADLISHIWSNYHDASAAEFRFLIKVVCDAEKNIKNVFTQALEKVENKSEIKETLHGVVTSKINNFLDKKYTTNDLNNARAHIRDAGGIYTIDARKKMQSSFHSCQKSLNTQLESIHPQDSIAESIGGAASLFYTRYLGGHQDPKSELLDDLAFITMLFIVKYFRYPYQDEYNQESQPLSYTLHATSAEILVQLTKKRDDLFSKLHISTTVPSASFR